MKTISLMTLASLAALALASCGPCDCHSPNKDYLRDVPVSRSQSFD